MAATGSSSPAPIPDLKAAAVAQLAPLVAIGCRSGDTVLGLSGVRRTRGLAYVLVDPRLAPGTQRELAQLQGRGTRVFRVEDLGPVRQACGRPDVLVIGVKAGNLADGLAARLVAAST